MILEGHDLDTRAIESTRLRVDGEQHGLGPGQDLRPAMRNLSLGQLRQRLGWAAGLRNSPQDSALGNWSKDDIVVHAPSSAPRSRGLRQGDRSAAIRGNLFELSAGEKGNPLPLWSEERTSDGIRSGQLSGRRLP